MAAIRFTEADRDEQGHIKALTPVSQEPRSLADLLPTPQGIQADAQRKPVPRGEQTMLIVSAIALAVVLFWHFGGGDAAPPRPASIPAATQASGDGAATPSPSPAALPAMLPAYASPDGTQLGEIEATRAITPTAHYGQDWIQADVQGSGRIWLRASDWPALGIVGEDLAPKPTATARPVPPTPTPEPQPPCLTAGTPGKMVEVCGWDDLAAEAQAKWLAAYGGSPGIVTTATPYVECSDHGKFIMCGGATP